MCAKLIYRVAALTALALVADPAKAGSADVLGVEARPSGGGGASMSPSNMPTPAGSIMPMLGGWSDGTVFGTRTLYHPHVGEQPFTRSLSGVSIPEGIDTVTVESHDNVPGWGGATVEVTLVR